MKAEDPPVSTSNRHGAPRTVFWGCARTIAVGNSLGDLFVPFFLGLAVQESDDDHGHVVAAYAAGL